MASLENAQNLEIKEAELDLALACLVLHDRAQTLLGNLALKDLLFHRSLGMTKKDHVLVPRITNSKRVPW